MYDAGRDKERHVREKTSQGHYGRSSTLLMPSATKSTWKRSGQQSISPLPSKRSSSIRPRSCLGYIELLRLSSSKFTTSFFALIHVGSTLSGRTPFETTTLFKEGARGTRLSPYGREDQGGGPRGAETRLLRHHDHHQRLSSDLYPPAGRRQAVSAHGLDRRICLAWRGDLLPHGDAGPRKPPLPRWRKRSRK